MQELENGAQSALDAAAREATALGAKRLASKLLSGMPRYEIVKVLEHDPAFDLLVLGTHGHTGLVRVLLGSIAEGIVRHAPCGGDARPGRSCALAGLDMIRAAGAPRSRAPPQRGGVPSQQSALVAGSAAPASSEVRTICRRAAEVNADPAVILVACAEHRL